MKTAKLFKTMQDLVDKHVEAYQSDFGIDKELIKRHPSEVLYYWYLRECGTFIASSKDMQWIESSSPKSAEFWLSQAKMIYEVHVDTQTIKSITPEKMTRLIKAAKPMPTLVKLEYLIDWMSQESVQENGRPWEVLYYIARDYKFKHKKIDELVHTCRGAGAIVKALEELKAGSLSDEEKERGALV